METAALRTAWKFAYWLLLPAWIIGAALNMWHVHGGFFTSYLADLTFPPWYYIVARGPTTTGKKTPFLLRWVGKSPARTALSLSVAGVLYEIAQRFHVIQGPFDLWDIAAYAFGLALCLIAESVQRHHNLGIDDKYLNLF